MNKVSTLLALLLVSGTSAASADDTDHRTHVMTGWDTGVVVDAHSGDLDLVMGFDLRVLHDRFGGIFRFDILSMDFADDASMSGIVFDLGPVVEYQLWEDRLSELVIQSSVGVTGGLMITEDQSSVLPREERLGAFGAFSSTALLMHYRHHLTFGLGVEARYLSFGEAAPADERVTVGLRFHSGWRY